MPKNAGPSKPKTAGRKTAKPRSKTASAKTTSARAAPKTPSSKTPSSRPPSAKAKSAKARPAAAKSSARSGATRRADGAGTRRASTAAFERAVALHGEGRTAEAKKLYQGLLEKTPGHGAALYNLGVIALQENDQDQALALFGRAVDIDPGHARALHSLGALQQAQGLLDAAADSFRRSIAARPAWSPPRRGLIQVLLAREQLTEAKAETRRFLEVQSVIADPRNNSQPRRVLALYGLDNPDFVLGGDKGGAFTFAINSGHFKIEDVIDHGRLALTRAFLGGGSDLRRIAKVLAESDLVINCIADPELESGSLERAMKLLRGSPLPVINDPARVLQTSRDEIYRRIQGIDGLTMAKTLRRRIEKATTAPRLLAEARLALPLIVRPVESHTGIDMRRAGTEAELQEALADFAGREVFLIAYQDFSDPKDRFFRKMRLFCIDGRFVPEHRLIFDHWNVHSADRLKLMRARKSLRAEEFAFLEDYRAVIGKRAAEALDRLPAVLGLDFFGVDFAILPDGEALVFEANPAMRINLDYVPAFPYQAGYITRITDAFKTMMARRLGEGRTTN